MPTAERTADTEAGRTLTLVSHCGIRFASVDGRIWEAEEPAPEPTPRAGADGTVSDTGRTAGTWTRVDRDTAHFVVDPARYHHDGSPIVFHPTDAEPPPCQ
ncbi:hypothetical protein [Saccharomonospora iraqiensis]|uniref:hypothetical protein n=1 Tax=Saccharomonospora iraqiensis TaxID=52698 RepID=UPI0002D98153|nr:hypothetical protein [Saccharomonospora iraqiensis]